MLSVDKALQSPLLSPPTSPQMPSYGPTSPSSSWQSRDAQAQGARSYTPYSTTTEDSVRPALLRSHRSVPNFLEPSHAIPRSHSTLAGGLENSVPQASKNKPPSSPGTHSEPGLSLDTSSIDTSQAHQLTTPTSPGNNDSGLEDDAAMMEADGDEDGDCIGDKMGTMSRADKRKMKRFRLTHNQTRFLMSEFARQAHPDAAQRERLSREIPGLSPRQVQVWFQNRRAKMKRLTTDDQERMLKSRALPEDFDMAQALHSPYGNGPMIGTPLTSPVSYVPPYGEAPYIRPLVIDSLRRQSDDDAHSPLSVHSSYGNNFYTPPGSDTVSPISTASDRHYGTLASHHTSPRGPNPLLRSSSYSPGSYQPPQIPRLQIQDRVGRNRADSLHSPLRSSMTYSTDALDYGQDRRPAAEQPLSLHNESSASPYGLGHQGGHLPSFQSSALNRLRPIGSSIPPGLQLKSEYRSAPAGATPHTPSFPMQSAPLAPPSEYQFPQLSAPYHSTSFSNGSYSHHSSSNATSYAQTPSNGAMPYHGQHESSSSEHQRQPHETSTHGQKRSPNLPIPSQTHFEIPKRSFTYDYGTSQP